MATTSTDPRDIEADLERERAALATTLDTLSDRVSVDNLAKEALGMLKSHAGTATTTIDHAVRANPVAMALIGAGIAWMFLGPRITGGSSSSSKTSSDYGSGYGATGSTEYLGSPSPSYAGGSPSYAGGMQGGSGFASSSGASSDYGRVGYVASDNDDDHAWSREAHGLRARAADALQRIEHEARSYYDSMKRGLSGMTGGGSGGERDFDAERQSVISGFTSDLKARLASGLDNLPPEARDRVIAARERAYGAMLQAEQLGRDAWRNPGRTMEEHPLVAGAVGFAVGAAVGAILPSTEMENRTFGAERDRLMDDAANLLRQERQRAMGIAGNIGSTVTQELKEAAQDTLSAVSDTVTQQARETATRVKDAAGEEIRHAAEDSGSGTSSGSSGSGMGGGSGMSGSGDPVIR